ncbi:hypothetical protein [Micromonospora echinaurantiaca]|uniref:hypothetical protein n=1 Tax=Micromonospora echinaurantiaca TaxID=47857 RepID=UPI003795158C
MELYVILLSIFSELVAFTAVGLIAGWGEVAPRWIPWVGGRRLPALTVAIPAAVGATALTLISTLVGITASLGRDVFGRPLASEVPLHATDWHGVLTIAAYSPLLLWGPLLGSLTVAYWKRRRRTDTHRRPSSPFSSSAERLDESKPPTVTPSSTNARLDIRRPIAASCTRRSDVSVNAG